MKDEFERLAKAVNFKFYLAPPLFEKIDFGTNAV
jgi:hypothetical protein